MRVKLLKAVYVRDGLHASGEVLELDQETANGLVLLGAAEPLEPIVEAKAAEPILAEKAIYVKASEEQAAEPQARSKRRKE